MKGEALSHLFVDDGPARDATIVSHVNRASMDEDCMFSVAMWPDGSEFTCDSILRELILVRSAAINTLRHGATISMGEYS